MLPEDEDEGDNLAELNWIGRLFGFAQFTNTRMVALVGDPDVPAYKILFSFDTLEHRQEFLELVHKDGHADPEEEATFMVPIADEIRDARPISLVFPERQAGIITAVGMITFRSLSTDASKSDA